MKCKFLLPLAIPWAFTSAYGLEGQIIDGQGQSIEGAEIEVVGGNNSAKSDGEGQFQLELEGAAELHISAPGFAHKIIQLDATQANSAQKVTLVKSVIEQVDVLGVPLHASIIESAMPIDVLVGDELRQKQAATLGDSLAGEIGVHTSFHGNVASTPIIRGLSGPRVLITQNSLDVSDVSRVGPDHSVATEVSTAEQVEILRGPATLFFGSGALGGVVNVVDKRVPTDTETEGEWILSRDSVNDQEFASFNLNTGVESIAFHVDGFWRESDDYRVPVAPEIDEDSDERIVENTAEESNGFTLGTSYILDNGYIGVSYGRLERDYGIPGHGHGDEEGHDEEEAGHDEEEEEEVFLGLEQDRFQLLSELTFNQSFINAVNTRIGYTDYTHTEFEDGETGTTFDNETVELKLDVLHRPLGGWHGGIVLDYRNSDFSALGEEAFAPPSETEAIAIAILEERHFGDVLIQLGARVEQVNVSSNDVTIGDVEFRLAGEEEEAHGEEEEEHDDEPFTFDEDYTPISVSLGAVWDFAPGYNIGVSLSRSERAPSAVELLSFGPHIATGTFEIGALFEQHDEEDEIHFEVVEDTPDLETSNNIDITFRKFEGDVGIILNAFYNQVENFYADFDTELIAEVGHGHEEEGEEAVGEEEETEELPVFLFQSGDATLHGFEAQGIWQINDKIKTSLFTDYVRAELDDGGNLPRIPPMRIGASFDYEYDGASANITWTHFSEQDDVAELETPTDGYNWINAHLSYRIPLDRSELTVFFKAENLGDVEARVHSSFLKDLAPRPGRNFQIGVRGTF